MKARWASSTDENAMTPPAEIAASLNAFSSLAGVGATSQLKRSPEPLMSPMSVRERRTERGAQAKSKSSMTATPYFSREATAAEYKAFKACPSICSWCSSAVATPRRGTPSWSAAAFRTNVTPYPRPRAGGDRSSTSGAALVLMAPISSSFAFCWLGLIEGASFTPFMPVMNWISLPLRLLENFEFNVLRTTQWNMPTITDLRNKMHHKRPEGSWRHVEWIPQIIKRDLIIWSDLDTVCH